jgi:excinuclease ABC subunit C
VLASEVLDRIPTDPGVYIFRDAKGEVIYVGKAVNLRSRVRQYFRPGGDERFFVAAGFLGRAVHDVETMVVQGEKEALLLENHLIKQHQPKFNVKLRDDKQYLVLRLVPPVVPGDGVTARAVFPRVEVVRNIRDDAARYFGPYHSATSARQTLRVLNRHFQLRTCTDHVLETRGRPCLQFQIKRCPAPCAFPIDPQRYRDQVEDAFMFLGGRDAELIDRLRARMTARAELEDFEGAAVLRDSLAAVERTVERQHIVQDDFVDQDVWGMYREADRVTVVVLFVRAGKLVGRRTFHQNDQELPDGQVVTEHVQLYYASGTFIPDEVVVGVDLEASDAIADWLGVARGKKVKVIEPRRGTRVRLVELADRNAAAAAVSRKRGDDDAEALLKKLQDRLGLRRLPRRIECFDIAHIQGTETVASMVTFVDGVAARALYRKFKIRTVTNDDFASMYEVITRRFKRAARRAHLAQTGEPDELTAVDDDAWAMPDLLVIDGGKGQLATALAALGDLGVETVGATGVDVIGLAKERDLAGGEAPDRVYVKGQKDAVQLRPNSPELYVLARIRDEAHRFANTFHRDRRTKVALRSELDDVPGIGATRRRNLLRHFGSVRGLRDATVDQLARAPGMNRKAAEAVAAYFATAPAAAATDDAELEAVEEIADDEVAAADGAGLVADAVEDALVDSLVDDDAGAPR